MNTLSFVDLRQSIAQQLRLRLRVLDPVRRASVFSRSDEPDALRRIYVINLDRRPDRWWRVQRELNRFRERNGKRLSAIARRFSAVDARYLESDPSRSLLIPTFTLADQLAVHPSPLLQIDNATRAREIQMTKQEIAIALSHIEVWRRIADGDALCALVLEDDVFLTFGFSRDLATTWAMLVDSETGEPDFDVLYLAYKEVGDLPPIENDEVRRLQQPGIWEASGYVLSRKGAQKLLDQLPVYGPVDLWLNMQFGHLRAFTALRPLIAQRIDEPSTNSYSVLPVLSQVGVITREKPLLPPATRLRAPVLALGVQGTGLTALAAALAMLGYTCVSDLEHLPADEEWSLRRGDRRRRFNAYVNIGSLNGKSLAAVAEAHSDALFISTTPDQDLPPAVRRRALALPPDVKDKWSALSEFLRVDYPSFPYPAEPDRGQRPVGQRAPLETARRATELKSDTGPWVLRPTRRPWHGIAVAAPSSPGIPVVNIDWTPEDQLDVSRWKLRDDTFPSNLALFTHANFNRSDGQAQVTLREEHTSVRSFTSAAMATRDQYLHGTFSAKLRPPAVSGVVTGLFLHRNGPRQEIDIELLGKDTTKMLVNVFYNPGPAGTKLEYGYRGTPTLIDLGFDAAADFHTYAIDWQPNAIRWLVDDVVVYERVVWDPTPIPDQPLQFNLNLWHSRSKEFAGPLASAHLPASASIRSIEIRAAAAEVTEAKVAMDARSSPLRETRPLRPG